MLDILIFVPTSLALHLTTSPLINEVRAVAMSNIDGVTTNHLLQQMYKIQVVDKDIDLQLSDEELELISNNNLLAQCDEKIDEACSKTSDVIVGGKTIISLNTVLTLQNDHSGLIAHIKKVFAEATPPIPITQRAAEVLSNNLRHEAPRVTKREHRGFKVILTPPYDGQICFFDVGCPQSVE